uniref:Uncharacterized protein n=2 Tax=Caenorhabditis tropicalis TaxID=1561998 RepID=A0A1I7TVG6_9PELO
MPIQYVQQVSNPVDSEEMIEKETTVTCMPITFNFGLWKRLKAPKWMKKKDKKTVVEEETSRILEEVEEEEEEWIFMEEDEDAAEGFVDKLKEAFSKRASYFF